MPMIPLSPLLWLNREVSQRAKPTLAMPDSNCLHRSRSILTVKSSEWKRLQIGFMLACVFSR